jgi:hypothetical protein
MCFINSWSPFSISKTEILERFQSKALRMIVDAPWYVLNTVILRDLQIPTVKEEIRRYSPQYSARLSAHPNDLIVNLIELPDNTFLSVLPCRAVVFLHESQLITIWHTPTEVNEYTAEKVYILEDE